MPHHPILRATDAVVVVAGLPGAGKTTLVAGLPHAIDSDRLRARWAPRLGRIPYACWRPALHLWHLVLVWRALSRPSGCLIVRPFTHAALRRAVLRRARRHPRAVHLVVVDVTPEQARAGQRARGRRLGDRAMRAHERRWARARFHAESWTTVTRLPRSAAAVGARGRPTAAENGAPPLLRSPCARVSTSR